MMTSASVSDPRLAEQRVTLVLCILASAVAIILATLVATLPWLAIVVLCALTFVVVYARKFGPRGSAVGLLAFIGYFLALYVGAKASQLHGHARRDPRRRRGRLRRALLDRARGRRARAAGRASILHRARAAPSRPGRDRRRVRGRSARRAQRIRRATGRVGEVALALEQAVGHADGSVPPPHVREWISSLLHAEVAVDMLVEAVQRLGRMRRATTGAARLRVWSDPYAHGSPTATSSRATRRCASTPKRVPRATRVATPISPSCGGVSTARSRPSLRRVRGPPSRRSTTTSSPACPSARSIPVAVARSGVPGPSPDLRLAMQATLAVALAVVAGRAISGARWYWAVLAAYVVFVRATTVGETFSRAWQRMLGTLVGVAIGLLVATLVGHRPWPAAVVGFVAIFLAYYLMRISYTGMIACFTVALALLYEEMGRAPAGLMALRLAETFAGAAIGVLVSALVLPVRSVTRVRALAAGVLRSATPAIERATTPGVRRRERRAAARRDPQRGPRAGGSARRAAAAVGTERAGRAHRRDAAGAHLGGARLRDAAAVGGVAVGRRRARRAAARHRRADDGQLPRRGGRAGAGTSRARRAGGRDARAAAADVWWRRRETALARRAPRSDRQTVSLLADMDVIVRELAEGAAATRG